MDLEYIIVIGSLLAESVMKYNVADHTSNILSFIFFKNRKFFSKTLHEGEYLFGRESDPLIQKKMFELSDILEIAVAFDKSKLVSTGNGELKALIHLKFIYFS